MISQTVFAETFSMLLTMWSTKVTSREEAARLGALYLATLNDAGLTDGDMRAATRQALAECDFFPPPARLIALAHPTAPALPPGDGGGPTTADLLRVQEQHRQIDAGLVRLGSGNEPADPGRVQAMIDTMMAEQRERSEAARAWHRTDAPDEQAMVGPRLRRQAKRKAALYEYAGRGEADGILDALRATGPSVPLAAEDDRRDRAWARKMRMVDQAEEMMGDRPERPVIDPRE